MVEGDVEHRRRDARPVLDVTLDPPSRAARECGAVVFDRRFAETDGRERPRPHPRMTQDRNAPGADAGPELTAELRRVARLFLLSAVTLALFLLRAAAAALAPAAVPRPLWVAWGLVLLTGWAATYVLAVYTTYRSHRWGWLALAAVPFTCVPAGVAYAWVRRREIEEEVLGARSPGKSRA